MPPRSAARSGRPGDRAHYLRHRRRHRALKAGAKAYVLKDISADALIACIHDVLAGKTYLAPATAAKLVERVTQVQLRPRELAALRSASASAR
jgi:DNA-binding NarL/FixJ family response regulator